MWLCKSSSQDQCQEHLHNNMVSTTARRTLPHLRGCQSLALNNIDTDAVTKSAVLWRLVQHRCLLDSELALGAASASAAGMALALNIRMPEGAAERSSLTARVTSHCMSSGCASTLCACISCTKAALVSTDLSPKTPSLTQMACNQRRHLIKAWDSMLVSSET